jgi:hypothetical protein
LQYPNFFGVLAQSELWSHFHIHFSHCSIKVPEQEGVSHIVLSYNSDFKTEGLTFSHEANSTLLLFVRNS